MGVHDRGTYWLVVCELGKDSGGQRRRKTRKLPKRSYRLADAREIHRQMDSKRARRSADAREMTVADLLSEFMAARQLAASTRREYQRIIDKCLVPQVGQIRVLRFAGLDMQRYQTWALRTRSTTTVRQHRAIVNAAFEWAVGIEWLPANPIRRVPWPEASGQHMEPISTREVETLRDNLPDGQDRLAFILGGSSGMRLGDVLALRWPDVELDDGFLWLLEHKTAKGSTRRRRLYLGAAVVAELRGWRTAQKRERLAAGSWPDPELVFSRRGEPWPLTTFSHRFKAATTAAGAPCTFHQLRHTMLTLLAAMNVHPKTAQRRVGHGTMKMTMDVYTHADDALDAAAAAAIDTVFAG